MNKIGSKISKPVISNSFGQSHEDVQFYTNVANIMVQKEYQVTYRNLNKQNKGI
jgi:hypothetical protein